MRGVARPGDRPLHTPTEAYGSYGYGDQSQKVAHGPYPNHKGMHQKNMHGQTQTEMYSQWQPRPGHSWFDRTAPAVRRRTPIFMTLGEAVWLVGLAWALQPLQPS